MNSPSAIINKILTFSAVDGPGNRLVVFFQGCNLACLNCHNPYTMGRCNDCGDCIPHCPQQELSMDDTGTVRWDADLCSQCDTCLSVCTFSASPKTLRYSVSELLDVVQDNTPFISGITLSGGEATTQLPFILAFLTALRTNPATAALSCLVDSNGLLGKTAWQQLLPLVDGVMLDIKAWHTDQHKAITGSHNHRVKASLDQLIRSKKLAELRFLLIPSVTDFDPPPDDLLLMLRGLSPETPIRINGFQHHGVVGAAAFWPPAQSDDISRFQQVLHSAGLLNVKIPVHTEKMSLPFR